MSDLSRLKMSEGETNLFARRGIFMRRISKLISAATVALISMLGFGSLAFATGAESTGGSRIVPSQALVQLEPYSDAEATLAGLNPLPVGSRASNLYLVQLDPFVETTKQIAWLGQLEGVAFAEPNYVLALQAEADDPKVVDGSSWGLYGSATSPSSSAGANAVAAWSSGYTGNSAVYVAVIDSGIDVSHPDLSANIWTNAGEIAGNGIDDDGNGFVDDVNGYDFINGDGTVFDAGEHPHGTHVAGIIGAEGNNSIGVSGVNWNVKLISAKMMNSDGQATIANAISAIDYITDLRTQKGLDIIASNNSWGGEAYSRALEDAIKRGGDAGIIFVAAAGNSAVDVNSTPTYPAAYDCTTTHRLFDCVVSVAALNEDGTLAAYSNFGATKVDIAAPGTNIMSTLPNGQYGLLSGTSMAAPFVSGSIALCVGAYRGTSAEAAISKLKATVVADANLSGKVATGGRLNVASHVSSCVGDATGFSGNLSEALTSATYTDRARVDWEDTSAGDYEQEIQVAVGPNGCRGTFSHFAFIGPGLTTYPALELEEAQFYCFRVRAIKDGSVSSWATSNVAITWTSNLPFIYGKVLMADGTPVHKMPVKWLAEGAYAGINNVNANTVYTNISGEYVMQASNGTSGYLMVNTTRSANSGLDTSPATPWGLEVGGTLTITQDANLDLTLPPIEYLNLRVTDSETGAALSGAKVQFVGYTKDCKQDGYLLFPNATSPTCFFWPGGYDHSGPVANANGEVTVPVVAGSQTSNDDYQFIVSDPNDANTSTTINWISGSTQNVDVVMNPPSALSGTVFLSDGTTPVAGVNVMWLNSGQSAGYNFRNALATTTDSNGAYSLEVPEGSTGRLFANTSRSPAQASPTTPLTPWGFEAGGDMTVSSSQTVNLTLPQLNTVTFSVTDHSSGNPVAGAKVEFNGYTKGCKRTVTYEAFPGATNPHCVFWPTGYSPSGLRTNASGQLSLAVLDDALVTDNNYSFLVVTPGANSTTTVVQVSPTEDTTLNVVTNPPAVLSGKIYLSDGTTPVEGAPVKWVNEGEYTGINYVSAQTSVTDSEGSYSLDVPPGSRGKLMVVTSRTPVRSAATTPQIPWGLEAGGFLTVTESRTVDLALPAQNILTFKVTEYASTDAIVGATVEFSGYTKNCRNGSYTPFPGAESPVCTFWPGGYAHSEPVTNSLGEAKIAVFDDSIMADNNYTWIVSHPFDSARVARVSITPTSSGVVQVGMPGTPSQPEQPEATALTEEVELTWTEPWNGGAYIDYYKVWVSLNADGPFNLVTSGSCAGNIDPDLRSCVVSDLTPGVTYYFAIIAHNIVGYSELSISIASVPMAAINYQVLTPTPSISGTVEVGRTVTAVAGAWDEGVALSYQWMVEGVALSGEVSRNLVVMPAHAGKNLSVKVTGRKTDYEAASKTSAASLASWPETVDLVALEGTPAPGELLTVQTSELIEEEEISYQWLRNGEAIAESNLPYYEVTDSDIGSELTVKVVGSNISSLALSAVSDTLEIQTPDVAQEVQEPKKTLSSISPVVISEPDEEEPAEEVTEPAPNRWYVQRSLKVFSFGATEVTPAMKALIKNQVESNPTADKFICTGIRREGGTMAENIMVRKRAKAACEYAKSLNPDLSTWYQSKVTKAPSYVGRVLLVIKGLDG